MRNFQGNDRFEIIDQIGTGGMGVVYAALDTEQDARVALKTLRQSQAVDIYRFKQEFRPLANLAHPNLVRMYELFSNGHEWFFTMELIEGTDFNTWVRGDAGPTGSAHGIERLRQGLAELMAGVRALHRAGKLHRDIKPSNTLVRKNGRVVLLDFGLVKDIGDGDETEVAETESRSIEYTDLSMATEGNVSGSINYMSPEQSAGTGLTEASDWYAVGAMLFEVLTRHLPFTGAPADVLTDKQTKPPPHPCEFADGLPAELADICHGLIATEPDRRIAALKDLDRFVYGTTPAQR